MYVRILCMSRGLANTVDVICEGCFALGSSSVTERSMAHMSVGRLLHRCVRK